MLTGYSCFPFLQILFCKYLGEKKNGEIPINPTRYKAHFFMSLYPTDIQQVTAASLVISYCAKLQGIASYLSDITSIRETDDLNES